MNKFQLTSDSFGFGEHGNYLADLKERLHVIVEYFLFTTPQEKRDDVTIHTQIAQQGMDECSRRNEEYFSNLKRNAIENPGQYLYRIDPNKLGPTDRFCIEYEIKDAKSEPADMDDFVREYTYAFTDPPYGIRCSDDEDKHALCSQTIARLFGDISDFTIRKWSTDWSNYFDAGNEWWGAFLWTLVSADGRGWWVGASSTD